MSRPHLFHFALIGALAIENVSGTWFNFWPIHLMTIINKKEKLFSAFKQLQLTAQLTYCKHTHCWKTVLYAPLKKGLPFLTSSRLKGWKAKHRTRSCNTVVHFWLALPAELRTWCLNGNLCDCTLLQSLECCNVCTSLGCINSSELCVYFVVVVFLACCCIACRSVFILMLFLLVSVCS